MSDLNLANVINISVSATQAGIGQLNTSNLAIFSRETAAGTFGTLGYKIYLDPSGVITDFGTSSFTAKMANAVFSQQPNILAGGGYLVVVQYLATGNTPVQHLAFAGTPASGSFSLDFMGGVSPLIQWNASAATVQTAIQTLPGLSSATVSGTISGGLVVTMTNVGGAPALLTTSSNTLLDGGSAPVVVTASTSTAGTLETLDAAITRTKDTVQYFGIMTSELLSGTVIAAAAAVVQPLNKLEFVASRIAADVSPGGTLDLLRTGSFSQTRGLFYGAADDASALVFEASYAGRALSTNFSGSDTTQTMHLKDLIGVQPDPSMTQTLLNSCVAAGADVYASFQGVPKVFTSGANKFFDDVYNLQAYVAGLLVAGFNALAQSSTKVPQTENGVAILKGAYRAVCEQYVANQYLAPGAWNNPTTFGNLADLLRNISERGYYIYSASVALQSSVDRAARKAPLIQIAVKEAGAIQSSSVIIYVNQ